MRFNVLGPLEVLDGEHICTPTAPKLRQVLALLLLNPNTVVNTDALAEELWGQKVPVSAATTLQTYVYQLRKLLSGIVTRLPGYMLTVRPDEIDVGQFEVLAERGREAMERGDPERAAALLRQALALWRGPALSDIGTGVVLGAHVARLEECRMTVLELGIETELKLGRHRELIGELKSVVAGYPLHESLHGHLMVALCRSGRRSEALEVYQQLRGRLIKEFGLQPSAELRDLQQDVLSGTLGYRPMVDSEPTTG